MSRAARRRSRSNRTARSPVAPTRAARATRLATSRLGIGLALAIQTAAILGSCTPGPPTPEPIARQYAAAWEKADYQTMWALLTDDAKTQVTTAGFVDRLPRIGRSTPSGSATSRATPCSRCSSSARATRRCGGSPGRRRRSSRASQRAGSCG
ncbi:MAG: hypothetical protein E6I51_01680 [Chloroflexi bacterium]|nr:MAG: hypothetical protein E6I51_01680 [Chloroflexota bacterium]